MRAQIQAIPIGAFLLAAVLVPASPAPAGGPEFVLHTNQGGMQLHTNQEGPASQNESTSSAQGAGGPDVEWLTTAPTPGTGLLRLIEGEAVSFAVETPWDVFTVHGNSPRAIPYPVPRRGAIVRYGDAGGSPIPAPGALPVLGLAIGLARRRRRH